MKPYHFNITFFFSDTRPFEEICKVVETALNCKLEIYETDEFRLDETYRGYVFGISIVLESAGIWGGNFTYRIAGRSRTADRFPDAPQIPLDHHIMELLKREGVTTFYTVEEYRAAIETNLVQSRADGDAEEKSLR